MRLAVSSTGCRPARKASTMSGGQKGELEIAPDFARIDSLALSDLQDGHDFPLQPASNQRCALASKAIRFLSGAAASPRAALTVLST